ncbi:hypothetical protein [Bradyrhizobium sp. SZCCHNS3051]|uniref:hypothetical protein n=1 Tax=Bradyrhizobium sp. SZCCHNS3051 TaxID=3057320 RepID=UPI002915D6E2|nr:hypothetical protein [Bradyrhizobium sp. SZCCHNS3051]
MDAAKVTEFRKKLLEDVAFRKSFAADPAAAMREAGIDIPADIKLPSIDHQELEERMTKLKSAMGTEAAEMHVEDMQRVASRSAKINSIGNIAVVDPNKIGRSGNVFTISAFGTLDW